VDRWELQHQSNEVGTISNLTYALDRRSGNGNTIELSYQTSQLITANQFATLAWRYRPATRSNWEAELGYGVGSVGGGWLASGAVNVFPGLNLRGRYQTGINSSTPTFSLEIVSNLETQSGWRENPQQLESLRTQGGIEIVPFFDRNGNGKLDSGEKFHLDLELINLNYRPLKPYRPTIENNRISLRVSPGKYRIDFDPAGLPINWRTQSPGYAVEVAAGGYTQVLVPLVPAYTIEGIVTDRSTKPVAGAKVELIPAASGESVFSITSRDGQFYLESLSQGSYQVQINGKASGSIVNLTKSSEPAQVLNLKLTD
jgi:Carboxypeptidase regulatory-like domain